MDAAVNHPQQGDFRITLLGTGSPRPSLTRHHPAAFVQWGEGGHMLVDAGDGVVSQLLAAGIALESITQIALTHMHWDHILGYPALAAHEQFQADVRSLRRSRAGPCSPKCSGSTSVA